MPISEDELDSNQDYGQSSSNGPALSKAELRKTNKPIMEKKRRARINQCLNELKDLILNAMKKDPARHSKLEKADILELTVKHLQTIQRQHLAAAAAADPRVAERFRAGFGECAAEVRRFLARRDAAAPAPPEPVARRLAAHLDRCVDGAPPPPARPPAADFALLPKIVVREHRPFQREADRASAFRSVRSGLRPASPPPSPAPSDCSAEASESEPESRAGASPFCAPPTPPSGASKESSPDTQKPTVSSTTVSPPEPPAAAESPRTAYGRENFKKRQIIVYQCEVSGGEPPRKRANAASDEVTSSDNAGNRASPADGRGRPSGDAPAANETMWRPW